MTLAKYMIPLKDELEKDPLGRGYADMTDQEAADSLMEKDIEKHRRVPLSEIQDWASAKRLYKAFVDNDLEDGSLHKELKLLLQGKQEDVNLFSESPGVQNLVQDLIDAGVVTEEESDDLMSLGRSYISRAEEIGFTRSITAQTIANVRAG